MTKVKGSWSKEMWETSLVLFYIIYYVYYIILYINLYHVILYIFTLTKVIFPHITHIFQFAHFHLPTN